MAFEKVDRPVPARVENVTIHLTKKIARAEDGTNGPVTYAATFVVRTQDANGGESDVVDGELLQHLTAAQVTSLRNFIDAMHVKATAEIING